MGTGRGRPVPWRLRADWIPAYAGMTRRRLRAGEVRSGAAHRLGPLR